VANLIQNPDSSEDYQDLIRAGLSIIPIQMPDKAPTIPSWKVYQTRLPRPGELSYNGSIALICGSVSGGLECLDFDLKNTTRDLMAEYCQQGGQQVAEIIKKLTVQTTVSGGFHFVFRCTKVGGNTILAKGKDQKVILETRGEGGYFVSAPTEGYRLLQGKLTEIQTITPEERDYLFYVGRLLNEFFEVVRPPSSKKFTETLTGSPPWEHFNREADIPALLQSHGWTYLKQAGENLHFCRPDKKGSTSATWSEEKRLLYVFTSSTFFEPSKAYGPAAIFAYLECNKDFSEAARKLYALGYGERATSKTGEIEEKAPSAELPTREKLRMTFKYVKKNNKPALTLNGSTLINFGEIFCLVGLPGHGKTAICEGIASTHRGKTSFGFNFNSNGKKCLFIDTERPPDDVCDSYHNIAKRLGNAPLDEHGEIEGLIHLSLSEFGKVAELKAILERELSSGEFDLVQLDGILDFSLSMNDDKDATEVVKWVRALAVKYNCAVVLTIHPNKNSDVIAGHLGSFLYRWCRAILYVRTVKGDKSVKELTGEPEMSKLSHADLGTLDPVYFSWNHEHKLLMACNYTPAEKRGQEDKMKAAFMAVLGGGKRLRYGELLAALVSAETKKGTAKRWITDATEKEIIHNSNAIYSLNENENS
jgi:hypothetical protein